MFLSLYPHATYAKPEINSTRQTTTLVLVSVQVVLKMRFCVAADNACSPARFPVSPMMLLMPRITICLVANAGPDAITGSKIKLHRTCTPHLVSRCLPTPAFPSLPHIFHIYAR